ncbi:MAG TPA: DUF4157 domain-containing protein [Longimicrobium sp.]|nr:DUF4157 domain-containing protein [Longimicrobium sp.]
MMLHASTTVHTPAPAPAPVLRRCACGGQAPAGGECAECRRKRLQRSASAAAPAAAPAIVHDVLRAPGAPLDAGVRAAMEPRFGHSFADVRVHADGRAAESAAAVGAHAYAVGRDVVFGAGRYAPSSVDGRRLIAHELAHVVQQSGSAGTAMQASLVVGPTDAPEERQADAAADAVMRGGPASVSPAAGAFLRRAAIYAGNILDEGSCEHLACNSKWGCPGETGVECPDGTRNAFSKTKKKYSPLFTCDSTCEKAKEEGCSDAANWMALPGDRFKRSKCGQDLVICANGQSTHATVRDRSEKDTQWEVSHGVQDSLGVSPYGSFTGTIYGDESDAAFKTDKRCGNAPKKADAPKKSDAGTDAAPDAGPDAGRTDGGPAPVPMEAE